MQEVLVDIGYISLTLFIMQFLDMMGHFLSQYEIILFQVILT
jgi:hypothetical protein